MADLPNVNRSIEQLEGDYWGAPQQPSTRLVEEAHRLRRVPLGALTIEDLRLLTGQQIALSLVVPLALHRLEDNPLAQGDFYEGDLLTAVLQVPAQFWSDHPDLATRLRTRLAKDRELISRVVPQARDFLNE